MKTLANENPGGIIKPSSGIDHIKRKDREIMINILLVCSAGMSTSMLVKKMQAAASEKGVEATIWAVGDAESQAESKKADVVLLGPQVRFLLKKMEERVDHAKPVAVIDMASYGAMNGAKVLDTAIQLVNDFKK